MLPSITQPIKEIEMRVLGLLVAMLASSYVFAGSTQEIFECRSGSGRTILEAEVPGDHAEHDVKFTIDGSQVHFFDGYYGAGFQSNSSVEVFGSLRDAKTNFHFIVADESGETVFTFLALPGSVNIRRTTNGSRGSLNALIVGKDPRDNSTSPTIQVSCDYVYEI